MKIAGIDPSMNSSGKCIMDLNDDLDIIDVKLYGYNKTKTRCISDESNVFIYHTGSNYTSLSMPARQNIAYEFLNIDMEDVAYIGYENYSMSSKSSSQYQIGEFVGGVKKMFYDQGKGYMLFAPKSVKRYATGNGNSGKIEMQFAYKEKYPQFYYDIIDEIPTSASDYTPVEDIVDAFWVAELMRSLMKIEKFGMDSIDDDLMTRLTYKSTKKSKSLIESELIKKI
jgi:Holliday junction resolvasome RuvABC endonuclease subunit